MGFRNLECVCFTAFKSNRESPHGWCQEDLVDVVWTEAFGLWKVDCQDDEEEDYDDEEWQEGVWLCGLLKNGKDEADCQVGQPVYEYADGGGWAVSILSEHFSSSHPWDGTWSRSEGHDKAHGGNNKENANTCPVVPILINNVIQLIN